MPQRLLRMRVQTSFFTAGEKRSGSFASEETANDLVNRTLERNRDEVDAVATGRQDDAFLKERFGFRTGREARASDKDAPYVRDTYGVGVLIVRDARSTRGYRVHTAYPRND